MSLSQSSSSEYRRFHESHPWLSFKIDLRRLDFYFGMVLGEVVSKIEHVAGVPLQPDYAKYLHTLYLAKGIAATTAIEGNTLTEDQVHQKIEGELELSASQEYLGQEIENIFGLCNEISKSIGSDHVIGLNVERIFDIHRRILFNLPLKDNVKLGDISERPVEVNGYAGAPREDCIYLLERLCEWLNNDEWNKLRLPTSAIATIKGIIAHVYIAWIHPFGDGNGRTARLVEFQILAEAGIPTPAIHLLSNYYNQTRSEYYRQLSISSKNGGDLIPFLEYAVKGLRDGLAEQIKTIQVQNYENTWENYIYTFFRGKNTESQIRQKELLLDLPYGGCEQSKIQDLTPRLARHYARRGPMAIYRDIQTLEKLGLIDLEIRDSERFVIPKRKVILGFLPRRKKTNEKEI